MHNCETRFEETRGRFGFRLEYSTGRLHPGPLIQFYVKSSNLSRAADLAISTLLTTNSEIDRFVDEAICALEEIRTDAKRALTGARENVTGTARPA